MSQLLQKYLSSTFIVQYLKVFFVGMLLHFLLQTFVTYKLGRDMGWMDVIRVRKELFVVVGGCALLVYFFRTRNWSRLTHSRNVWYMLLVLLSIVILTFLLTLGWYDADIGQYVLAFKYDFFGFGMFFVSFFVAYFLSSQQKIHLADWYVLVMKWCLAFAVLWWCVILVKPGTLEVFFGYDRDLHESDVGMAPPAVYYTQERFGYTRNQFLFERPIHLGFWLVAFWPLFFVLVLKRKRLHDVWGRWLVYGFNIAVTFSRAAWLSRVVITILLLFLTYKATFKKILIKAIIPLALGFGLLLYIYADNILHREYSNTGHIEMVQRGRDMFLQKPFLGHGPATAGPGSHHLGDKALEFNPENQFLQVLDEFGIVGGLPRIVIFTWFVLGAYPAVKIIRKTNKKSKLTKQYVQAQWLYVAMALGMGGLGISGLVLHSFSDRMIVYPVMVMYGVILQHRYSEQQKTLKFPAS